MNELRYRILRMARNVVSKARSIRREFRQRRYNKRRSAEAAAEAEVLGQIGAEGMVVIPFSSSPEQN